jgi:hypothetical protein
VRTRVKKIEVKKRCESTYFFQRPGMKMEQAFLLILEVVLLFGTIIDILLYYLTEVRVFKQVPPRVYSTLTNSISTQ